MQVISTPAVEARPYLMQNQIQHYEWGTHDEEAYIPRLLGIVSEPGIPYGELWMGAHPKAPSHVIFDEFSIPLDRWIASHPLELLGPEIAGRFNGNLPFLFKVLAAGEALSIQAHPNKAQAKLLHAQAPQHYPDDNHKPEVAIALDSLTALMGIKPFDELVETLQRYPEIAGFIGNDIASKLASASATRRDEQLAMTREIFVALLSRSMNQIAPLAQAIDTLHRRLGATSALPTEAEQLFLDLRHKYPGPDVGLLALFLMNLVHLKEGEGMFAEAGVPHAYLKGNIIECMANSDNVVRVGLTTKFKDARALIEILRYEPGPVSILGADTTSETTVYVTPAPEFRVSRLRLKPGSVVHELTHNRPQVYIVTQGAIELSWDRATQRFKRGQSVFIPAVLPQFSLVADSPSELFKVEVPI
jgi:mannose-6-phosphate isomerase